MKKRYYNIIIIIIIGIIFQTYLTVLITCYNEVKFS
jgi:hypothetical protein